MEEAGPSKLLRSSNEKAPAPSKRRKSSITASEHGNESKTVPPSPSRLCKIHKLVKPTETNIPAGKVQIKSFKEDKLKFVIEELTIHGEGPGLLNMHSKICKACNLVIGKKFRNHEYSPISSACQKVAHTPKSRHSDKRFRSPKSFKFKRALSFSGPFSCIFCQEKLDTANSRTACFAELRPYHKRKLENLGYILNEKKWKILSYKLQKSKFPFNIWSD